MPYPNKTLNIVDEDLIGFIYTWHVLNDYLYILFTKIYMSPRELTVLFIW